MTADEVARILRFRRQWVNRLAQKGQIKAHKDGRQWIFDAEDVLRWKAERPGRKPPASAWRNGMVLGRQNWRCRECSQLNTRMDHCRKCGAAKKENTDVLR